MASLLSLHLPKPNPNHLVKASSSSLGTSTSTTTTSTTTTTSSSSSSSQATPQSLEEKFGRKGIKFTESGNVELTVRNGSSLSLRIADGLVTSYKPKVYWKEDGFEEVLYTIPEGNGSDVKGGLSLVLNDVAKLTPDGSQWTASRWTVKDSDSDSIDAVQVELSCANGHGSLEITYVVSLYLLCMATAVVVKNNGQDTVKLTSAILSHLRFRNRRKSAIQGLRGCSYCSHSPLPSRFGILSPAQAMEPETQQGWSFFGRNDDDKNDDEDGSWIVEDNLFTMLSGKFSRVYTAPPTERSKRIYRTPPSKYETIDQGRGLGFRVIRMGYEDIYVCSPGASSQKYGKDHFICTGPASMLVPMVLNPGEQWRGAQVIEHDNL